MKIFSGTVLAVLVVSLAACSGTNAPPSSPPALSTQDSTFVTFAAESSNSEIAAAQLAEKNSQNASVQQFAQKMITDHTNANNQLAATTSVKVDFGPLPTTSLPNEATIAAQLATLTGTAFDQAYITDQVNAHEATIAQFQQEINNGTFTDLKAFATAQLPILQMHLQMAQQLQATPGI